MAVVVGRQRVSVLHNGGRVSMTRGLAQYLGIASLTPVLGLTAKGNRRHARKGAAVAGKPYIIQLDDLSMWTVSVVGSMKSFEDAYFVARRAPKMVKAWSPGGVELVPRTDD